MRETSRRQSEPPTPAPHPPSQTPLGCFLLLGENEACSVLKSNSYQECSAKHKRGISEANLKKMKTKASRQGFCFSLGAPSGHGV